MANTAYKWKTPFHFKVDAQKAGEELERISVSGSLTPERIVDESRAKNAVLHNQFDWNNETAAESYRQVQAREILRNIVTVTIEGEALQEPVRAFVRINNDYKPLSVVIRIKEYQEEMYQQALAELKNFQRKYKGLSQLEELIMHIEKLTNAS